MKTNPFNPESVRAAAYRRAFYGGKPFVVGLFLFTFANAAAWLQFLHRVGAF